MRAIAELYRAPSNRISYRKFCTCTDNAFLTGVETNLERLPTLEVAPLLRSQVLSEDIHLCEGDEAVVQTALLRLQAQVTRGRIQVHPLMQDMDRQFGFTKGITRSQLERVLETLGLSLTIAEVPLLFAKFRNPVTGHFNYHNFVAAIDVTTKFGQTEQLFTDTLSLSLKRQEQPAPNTVGPQDLRDIFDRIMMRLVDRNLRAIDFFTDQDPLRKGKISRAQFIRGVGAICPALSSGNLDAVADQFAISPTEVQWKSFCNTVDSNAFAQVLRPHSFSHNSLLT